MNFKEAIFVLYDLGISLSALSKIYKEANEEQVHEILEGDFLSVQFSLGAFSDKDIDLLSSKESVDKSKAYISKLLIEFSIKKIHYFFYYDKEFPKMLKGISSPPFLIFTKGNLSLLEENFICSIVGTRKPTNHTLKQIEESVKEMVAAGVVVASGLALGTDIHAHRSTLKNKGKTLAVLPSPLDNITPKSHIADANEIIDKDGLLISEYYKRGSFFRKANYVDRNRIISGLSNAVLIAECSEKSGTMHTARFAYKQNRPLYCFNNESSGVQKILNSNTARIYKNITDLHI
ncbi:DNA-processing protein DprA [Desertibacillus haloalkaliphilus]|uniref:DNA-processing protein DprA n=1 Tax=Desertibacillus haloalkaliphilus TaxID=1328930 RepID=UPI001C267338|nr:DNA-processing protein DprA [Desertibacillus haloalkaliphilus]MBU8908146.1 DNA-protecting protein DprA [Desertibacillus haloalkaliphilus]